MTNALYLDKGRRPYGTSNHFGIHTQHWKCWAIVRRPCRDCELGAGITLDTPGQIVLFCGCPIQAQACVGLIFRKIPMQHQGILSIHSGPLIFSSHETTSSISTSPPNLPSVDSSSGMLEGWFSGFVPYFLQFSQYAYRV